MQKAMKGNSTCIVQSTERAGLLRRPVRTDRELVPELQAERGKPASML